MDCKALPTSGINRERSPDNNQLEQSTCYHMHLLRKGRSARLLPTRHSVQLWRPPGVNNNSEECKSHSGHAQVHAQNVSTMALPRHPGRAMTFQTYPPSSSNLKSSSLLLEKYFPKLAVHNGRGSPSNRPNVLAHVASCIHSVVRQRDPLRQVS